MKYSVLKFKNSKRKRIDWVPYFFLIPPFLVLIMVYFYPLAQNIIFSFFRFKGRMSGGDFVGLGNYKVMLMDPRFWNALKVSGIYTAGTVGGSILIGLMTATLINLRFKGRNTVRAIVVLPWAIPYIVTCLVWTWMYDSQFGIFNYILQQIHVVKEKVNWLTDSKIALFAVLLPSIWKLYPIASIMLLAGLQNIPKQTYEAAEIDGANIGHKFVYITLPGLYPVMNILVILLTVWTFGSGLIIVYLLTEGGPGGATENLVLWVYLTAFKFFKMSYAATIGIAILLVSLIFTAAYLQFAKGVLGK